MISSVFFNKKFKTNKGFYYSEILLMKATSDDKNILFEIAITFLKLGFISFGGPAAQLSLMENEMVEKKKWMTFDRFIELMGFTNLIPGSTSVEMAINCGYEKGGKLGLWIAGIAYIIPAAVLSLAIGVLYAHYGMHGDVRPYLNLFKAPVIAIIIIAVYRLARKSLKTIPLLVIGLFVMLLALAGINEVEAILMGGLFGTVILFRVSIKKEETLKSFIPFITFTPLQFDLLLNMSPHLVHPNAFRIFVIFFKIGAVLFGGGYVLFAYLNGELIDSLGWISKKELIDAITIGQFTPGSFLSTATFIGYQLDGYTGAIAATVGIFLPAFFIIIFVNPLIPIIKRSKLASLFLDAVNVSAVGIMAEVTIEFGKTALISWENWLVALFAAFVAIRFPRINTFLIILGGVLLGLIIMFLEGSS